MFIFINGFIPNNNDLLGNGGRSIKVAFIPIEEMTECKRTGYNRVYDEECNYTCPQITVNETKKTGEFYWENRTLCGSKNQKKENNSHWLVLMKT